MSHHPVAELDLCRDRIDDIDRRLLLLLNERTQIVQEIGRIKQAFNMAIYEPKREDQVYDNISKSNEGPMPDDCVKRIFERIIDEMRTIQKRRMLQTHHTDQDT